MSINKEKEMEIKEIKNLLKSNVCEVVFTKADGTERTMKATLQAKYIPIVENNPDKPKRTKKAVDGLVTVYDVEKEDWRSFKVENIISFTILNNYNNNKKI